MFAKIKQFPGTEVHLNLEIITCDMYNVPSHNHCIKPYGRIYRDTKD